MNTNRIIHVRIDGKRHRVTSEDIGHDIEVLQSGCPHCGGDKVKVVTDILQLGFFEDRGLLIRTCEDCGKLYAYHYSIECEQEQFEGEQDDTIQ